MFPHYGALFCMLMKNYTNRTNRVKKSACLPIVEAGSWKSQFKVPLKKCWK